MLVAISRWDFRLEIGDTTITICGEMLVPTPGLTDFLIIASSVERWDPPFEAQVIDEATKQTILQTAMEDLTEFGRVPEIV